MVVNNSLPGNRARSNPMKHFVGSRAMPEVNYHRPKELGEALAMIHEFKDNCILIAGGTDLIPALRRGTVSLESRNLVDLRWLKELDYIRRKEDWIQIGAVTRLSDLEDSEIIRKYAPVLSDAAGQIGSLQIRNQGTLGGNLCNASPAADTAPPLLALRARVLLKSLDRQRVVPLDQFFLGPGKTLLMPGEILAEIQVPIPQDEERFCFLKLGRRNAFTLSIVSVATWVKVEQEIIQGIRIALGAVAPTPMRALKSEEYLAGQRVSEKILDQGAKIVSGEVQPLSDVRANAEYRKDMSYILTRRAILFCVTPNKSKEGDENFTSRGEF